MKLLQGSLAQGCRRPVAFVIAAAAALTFATGALAVGDPLDTHKHGLTDFDARTGTVAPTATQQQLVSSMGARATWNRFGTPHTLVKHNGFLATGVSAVTAVAAAKYWLSATKALFRLTTEDNFELHSDSKLA